jgi:hypothetical protein
MAEHFQNSYNRVLFVVVMRIKISFQIANKLAIDFFQRNRPAGFLFVPFQEKENFEGTSLHKKLIFKDVTKLR